MRTFFPLLLLLILVVLGSGCNRQRDPHRSSPRSEASRTLLVEKLTAAEAAVGEMLELVSGSESPSAVSDRLITSFQIARSYFKQVEFITGYHYPGVTKKINGPALPTIEEYDPNAVIIEPEGFQVIEELIYTDEPIEREALETELNILTANLKKVRQYNEITTYTDRHVIESVRLGLVRLLSLGLSGFDSPVAQQSVPESAYVLQGMAVALAPYLEDAPNVLAGRVRDRLAAAIEHLRDPAHEFVTFDRLAFIRDYANPLSESIYELASALDVEAPPVPKPLNKTTTIFAADAFNTSFFAPPYAGEATGERIALGELLFFDPVLSGNNQRSCASCHRPELAFTDGLPKSVGFEFEGTTQRNAPTLINAGLQPSSSYDLKTLFIEDRVTRVFESELELHTSLDGVVQKLNHSPEYRQRFNDAFGPAADDDERARHIRIALSDYVRSLYAMNSPFDRYARGESDHLDEAAQRGFTLFMGKALCGTCHFLPLFNGVVPPDYAEHEAEIIGVPDAPDTTDARIDPDPGKYVLYQYDLHRFSFKTPTVRNAALTAPYMHNGIYRTLEEVVDFYNRGGGAGIGIDLEFQTLPPDPLNLTDAEAQDLVAFMESLTDTTRLTSRPTDLPVVYQIDGQTPIQRIVGGVY